MKNCLFILIIALATNLLGADIIKLDTAAFNPQDSTAILQKAFASGAKKVIVTHQNSPWMVKKTLLLSSDQEIIFEDGAELKAMKGSFKGVNDVLLLAKDCKNLSISGRGILTMNKKDYQNPEEYEKGEWRHTLALFSCENIKIDDLTMQDSGGDGIYINRVKDIMIDKVILKNHLRQGISVISAENLLIKNSLLENTSGASPMAGIDFEPNNKNEYLINCIVEKCRFINNKGAGVLVAIGYLNSDSRPISISIKDCELSKNSMGVSIANFQQAAVSGEINFINCRISASQSFTFQAISQTVNGYKISLKNCILDNRNASSNGAFEITGGRVSGPLGNLHFDKVKVIDNRRNAIPFKFDGGRMHPLQKITGSMADASGKIIAMSDIVKKYQSAKTLGVAKLNLEKLFPVCNIVKKTSPKLLRMRFNGTFVQYAKKDEMLKVKVTAIQFGRNMFPVKLDIISPDGKLLKKRNVKCSQKPEIISFKAKESGMYCFKYQTHGNGVNFSSDYPGNGYLVSSPIFANHNPAKVYFLVPAGASEVAVRVSGDGKETVTAALLNPAGRVIIRKKKISSPKLLSWVRKNPNKTEIWSIDFSQAVDDFNFAILGEAIPIISDAPNKLLKYN